MEQILNDKILFLASLVIVSFFGFIYLDTYYFKIDFVLIGVFREMLTFPLMLLQVVILVLAFKNLISTKYSFKNYSIWTVGLLLSSLVLTWGSVFS